MSTPTTHLEQLPDRMLAGALAHLAQHMESGCRRAAYLAAMLLEQIASDPRTSKHLKQHTLQIRMGTGNFLQQHQTFDFQQFLML